MKKSRIEYAALISILFVLFVVFEKTILLWAVIGLILFAFLSKVFVYMDTGKVSVKTKIMLNAQKNPYLDIEIIKKRPLIFTNQILIHYVVKHTLFNHEEDKTILLALTKEKKSYHLKLENLYCGQIQIECKSCVLLDVFRLFTLPIQHKQISSSILYPSKTNIQLGMIENDKGMVDFEGVIQNKRGNDLSEIFDIRKYKPGDDVRSIHWKLSQKIDDIVVREASNLSQYNILLIPDLALEALNREEMNIAISLVMAVAEKLLEKHVGFCISWMSENQIQIHEISNLSQFHEILNAILSTEAWEKHGEMLKYLLLNQGENSFAKYIVIGNGKFKNDFYVDKTEKNMSVIHACADIEKDFYVETQNVFDMYVPVHQKANEIYSLYY